MSDDNTRPIHPFANVRVRVAELGRVVEGSEVDLLALGKAYAALAVAVHEDVLRAGQSSMRFEAVRKALDLRTPKSELVRFLDRAPSD